MFPERVSGKTHSECGQSIPQPESRDGIKGQMETSSLKSFSFLLPGQPGASLLFFPQVALVRYIVEGPASPVSRQMTTITMKGKRKIKQDVRKIQGQSCSLDNNSLSRKLNSVPR